MAKQSQCKCIIEYCKKYGFITAREAVVYLDCFRLAARIADLEGVGHKFDHQMVYYKDSSGLTRHYMKYKLLVEKVS